jgi:hypothetical protein
VEMEKEIQGKLVMMVFLGITKDAEKIVLEQ